MNRQQQQQQQQQQSSNIWIIIFGVLFGVILVFFVNSFRSTGGIIRPIPGLQFNQNLAIHSSLTELQTQKQKLIDQLKEIDEAITKASKRSVQSIPTAVPATFPVAAPITKPSNNCKYNFKVYVYPIPKSIGAVQISEEARRNGTLHVCRKCILEQFALEYITYDFFQGFCGRTMNPEEADYFYLPLVRDAEFRRTMELGGIRSRAPSAAEQALLNIMEKNDGALWQSVFNISDKYWHRKQGSDHIIVMPAPVTNLRHETSKRGFFHYMMQLKPPIFISLEYSKSFVDEYPICSSLKNIVAPYPTTDPEFYNGKLLAFEIQRDYLLYYAGGLHGDCIEIRKAMKQLMVNSTHLHKVIPPIKSNQHEREHGFLAAKFCPIPVGDSPSSKRMYDVLNFGCIPVVVSDDLVWAFSDQTGGPLNHSSFSIQLPQSVVQYSVDHSLRRYRDKPLEFGVLPSGTSLYQLLKESKQQDPDFEKGIYVNPLVRILRRIPESDIEYLRTNGKIAAKSYHYYEMNKNMEVIPTAKHAYPDGGAMDVIAAELQKRKDKGIEFIRNKCMEELTKIKHKYVFRYPCESDKLDSLIRRRRRRM